MSFSSDTKKELSRIMPEKKCCMLAEIAGFIRVCGSIRLAGGGKFKIVTVTENAAVARHYKTLIREYFKIDAGLEVGISESLRKRRIYMITIGPDQMSDQILRETGIFMIREGIDYISDGIYDVEEYITGMVRLEDEGKVSTITLEGAWAQNIGESDTYIDFIGDKAGIRLQYGGGFKLYSTCNGMLTETQYEYASENMYSREVRDFLTNAPKKIKTRASIDHAIKTSELMELLYKSAAEHREIEL